jgi:hypothetical protein
LAGAERNFGRDRSVKQLDVSVLKDHPDLLMESLALLCVGKVVSRNGLVVQPVSAAGGAR